MQVRTLAASGVLIGATSLVLGVAAPAQAVCDSYSGGCPSGPPAQGGGNIGGTQENPGSGTESNTGNTSGTTGNPGGAGQNPGGGTVSNPASLPFTGGELVLLTALGAGALAGGTALVVAGRRRTSPAA